MNDKHKDGNSEVLTFTGERFVPEVHGNIELEHLHRYLQACEIAAGIVVLDIASGEGYGSAMLASRASKVIGVDISADIVKHARKRYQKENLDFMVGNCADIPLPDASVDLIVSFETIEHHDQHEKMMQEVKRVLRPNGVLLISSPDKYQYSVEPGWCNPYHIKELYQQEFKQLLENYFKNVAYFGQRIIYGSGIFAESVPTPALSYFQENEIVKEASGIIKPVYWIALASDFQLPNLASGVLEQPINDSEIIQSWSKVVAERDGQIIKLNQTIAERERQIVDLSQSVSERDREITSLRHSITQGDSVHQTVIDRDRQIASLNQAVNVRDGRISALTQLVEQHEIQIHRVLSSRSWRYTKILRVFGRILRGEWAEVWASIKRYAHPSGRVNQFVPSTAMQSEQQANRSNSRVPIHSATSLSNVKCVQSRRRRILLVSYYCPSRAHAGGMRILDIYNIIKTKYPDIRLDLYTHRRPEIDGFTGDIENIFDSVYFSPLEELTAKGLLSISGDFLRYDVIDLQFHGAAYDLKGFQKLGGKVLFTPMESQSRVFFIDVRAVLAERRKVSLHKMASSLKQMAEEVIFCFQADEVVCVSRPDAALLRAITCLRKITSIDTGISSLEFSEALANRPNEIAPETKDNIVIFVAYFGSESNIVALRWYLDNVHPLIKAQVPDYILRVVGRGDLTPFRRYQDSAVDLVGAVASVVPYIEKAKVGIAPALGGSGFRGKINQYAILNVPCVASPIAAKGLAYRDGIDIFVAADSDGFARRCIELLKDFNVNETIAKRAKETCLARYTWESKLKAISDVYNLDGAT